MRHNLRELLELAAKAARVKYIKPPEAYDGSIGLALCDDYGNPRGTWDPSRDKSQAFELQVALDLEFYKGVDEGPAYWVGYWKNDPTGRRDPRQVYCVTRIRDFETPALAACHAVLLAAAEVGRQMKD